MIVNTDIDIDVADRNKLLKLIKHNPATINEKNRTKKNSQSDSESVVQHRSSSSASSTSA